MTDKEKLWELLLSLVNGEEISKIVVTYKECLKIYRKEHLAS